MVGALSFSPKSTCIVVSCRAELSGSLCEPPSSELLHVFATQQRFHLHSLHSTASFIYLFMFPSLMMLAALFLPCCCRSSQGRPGALVALLRVTTLVAVVEAAAPSVTTGT